MTFFQSQSAETALSANNFAMLDVAVFATSLSDSFSAEDRQAYHAAWAQPGALTGGLNYYRAPNLAPTSKTNSDKGNGKEPHKKEATLSSTPLPSIQTPTLVLWGEKDTALLFGNLEGLESVVKTLTVKRIPSAGHWIVHEEPETVNRAIREFLQSPK